MLVNYNINKMNKLFSTMLCCVRGPRRSDILELKKKDLKNGLSTGIKELSYIGSGGNSNVTKVLINNNGSLYFFMVGNFLNDILLYLLEIECVTHSN